MLQNGWTGASLCLRATTATAETQRRGEKHSDDDPVLSTLDEGYSPLAAIFRVQDCSLSCQAQLNIFLA